MQQPVSGKRSSTVRPHMHGSSFTVQHVAQSSTTLCICLKAGRATVIITSFAVLMPNSVA
jgi:hypothetical protein